MTDTDASTRGTKPPRVPTSDAETDTPTPVRTSSADGADVGDAEAVAPIRPAAGLASASGAVDPIRRTGTGECGAREAEQIRPAGARDSGPDGTGAADLIRLAGNLIADRVDPDDPIGQAAQHLVASTADFVASLPGADLASAQEALGSARAAVGVAGYIVCRIGDTTRRARHRSTA